MDVIGALLLLVLVFSLMKLVTEIRRPWTSSGGIGLNPPPRRPRPPPPRSQTIPRSYLRRVWRRTE